MILTEATRGTAVPTAPSTATLRGRTCRPRSTSRARASGFKCGAAHESDLTPSPRRAVQAPDSHSISRAGTSKAVPRRSSSGRTSSSTCACSSTTATPIYASPTRAMKSSSRIWRPPGLWWRKRRGSRGTPRGLPEGAGRLRHDLRRARQDVPLERTRRARSSRFAWRATWSRPSSQKPQAGLHRALLPGPWAWRPRRRSRSAACRCSRAKVWPRRLPSRALSSTKITRALHAKSSSLLLRQVDHALTFTLGTPLRFPTDPTKAHLPITHTYRWPSSG